MLSAKVTCVLDCFPPRSQTHLSPGLHTLVRLQNGSSTNPSKAQTIRTHRLHFIWWTRHHYRIYDSLFPHIHHTVTTEALNLLMALYASHLLSGHSLLCKTVRTDTALKYLQAASSFLTHFDHDTSSSDARHRPSSSHTLCPKIGAVIKAAKRFESVPNCHKPFTIPMLLHYRTQHVATNVDSLQAALVNWLTAGLVTASF